MTDTLTPALAAHFAQIALGHVRREYPNKPDHTLAGPQDARTPQRTASHLLWQLRLALLRAQLLDAGPGAAALSTERRNALDPRAVRPAVRGAEGRGGMRYFAAPTARGFKRPYGWAWLLKLAAELALQADSRWAHSLAPLAE
jgi:hypothetical protein